MVKKKRQLEGKIKNAKPEHYFILVTGVPLKNIKELVTSLDNMNDWVFRHHVNDARNDFANWVRDIFREEDLAREMHAVKEMRDMQVRILKYLVNKYL